MGIDTIIIIALLSFITGLVLRVSLSRPTTDY